MSRPRWGRPGRCRILQPEVTFPLQDAARIRVELPQAEADRLDQLFRSTDDPKLRDRLQILLMAHRGRARQDIPADVGVDRRTVTRWINAHRADGLDGLRPKKATGAPGKIPAGLADEVRRWVIEGRPRRGSTGPTGPLRG